MRRFLLLFMVLFFVGCADKPSFDSEPALQGILQGTQTTVTIKQLDDNWWKAEYLFSEPQNALIFSRSLNDYRGQSWTSLDPNVSFKRIAGFDTILLEQPAAQATFKFKPYSGNLERDYTAFIPFSDGGYAVYTGQFEVLSVEDRTAIENLKGSLRNWNGEQGRLGLRLISEHPMILNGEIGHKQAIHLSQGGGTYIYVGTAKITQGKDFSGVIDPGLPEWINKRFDSDISKIFAGHRTLWGEGLNKKSTLLLSFKGYDINGFSNSGGALGNLITMELSGTALKKENKKILQYLHWFFAHEVAHTFQTRHGLHARNLDDNWMNEGAANAMANQVMRHQKLAGQDYFNAEYAKEFAECSTYLKKNKLTDYANTGEYNIPYSCGDLIAQITDASLKNHTLFEFWNEMLDNVKQDEQREKQYTTEDYFKTLEKLGASQNIRDGLKQLTTEKISNPAGLLKSLMEKSGLEPEFNKGGELVSIKLL